MNYIVEVRVRGYESKRGKGLNGEKHGEEEGQTFLCVNIRAFIDDLPDTMRERRFTKLSDGFTKRRYVIAEVYMMTGNRFNIIEVERENRSLSTIILSSNTINSWTSIYNSLLVNLVNDSGAWTNKSLSYLENLGVVVLKAKHSTKEIRHRAEGLLTKLL